MNAKTITKEVLRIEFGEESREFEMKPFDKEPTYEPDWQEYVNTLKTALKNRMEKCRINVMTNKMRTVYCAANGILFKDHTSFSVKSYEDMEDAYNRLCDNYAKPQERIGLMSRWEAYQCLKALAEFGLSHEALSLFDYVLSIYQNRVIEDVKF